MLLFDMYLLALHFVYLVVKMIILLKEMFLDKAVLLSLNNRMK